MEQNVTHVLTTSSPVSLRSLHDEALFNRMTLDSDQLAFEVLFKRHYTPLCRFVFTMVNSRVITEEIVSDVLLKIWNCRHTLQIQSSLKAYLVTSARNLSIDHQRRLQRRRHLRSSDEVSMDLPCQDCTAHERLVGQESNEIVEAAINRLPPQGQAIFRLSRDNGMKYREIADHLGLSIKTVETHMTRSLVFLRQEVGSRLEVSGL